MKLTPLDSRPTVQGRTTFGMQWSKIDSIFFTLFFFFTRTGSAPNGNLMSHLPGPFFSRVVAKEVSHACGG